MEVKKKSDIQREVPLDVPFFSVSFKLRKSAFTLRQFYLSGLASDEEIKVADVQISLTPRSLV